MEKNALNRFLTVILSVFLVILVITFSIGLPIYFRPFYYMQIDSLGIEEYTWHTKEEIKEAYNLLLDYLTLPNKEFSTGVFQYSEDGKSHFEDCKNLFNLNLTLFIISLIIIVTIFILHKREKIKICRPCGYNFTFITGISALTFFGLLICLCSIDFDTAFTVFHWIFFPGKDNFYFDPYTDGIILILPLKFFERCAILIASVILLSLLGFIIYAVIEKKKVSKN
jgi:integral membrane protein (TIGR01906 family)